MDEEYFLKWILLESELQYNQEKYEVKETEKVIIEIEYEIEYFKNFLADIEKNNLDLWSPIDITSYEDKLIKLNSQLKYYNECRKNIIENLRNSKDYGLNNTIMIT
tara:strand:+ start:2278 stop:2595 length:318 start_codon:yes stop_codon:yes gene_type:complete